MSDWSQYAQSNFMQVYQYYDRYKVLLGNITRLLPMVLLRVVRTRNGMRQPTCDISRNHFEL